MPWTHLPVFLLLLSPSAVEPVAAPVLLVDEQTVEIGLAPQKSMAFAFEAAKSADAKSADAKSARYLVLEQVDLDLKLSLCPEGEPCRNQESPLDRYDRWPLLLPTTAGRFELEPTTAGAGPAGRVRLHIEELEGPRASQLLLALGLARTATASLESEQDPLELFRQAAAAFELAGDAAGKAWALHAAARTAQNLRLAREALPLFAAARDAWKEKGDLILAAYAEQGLASMQMRLGNNAAAREILEESLADFRRLHIKDGIAGALADLGLADHLEGHYEAALEKYHQALELYREQGNRPSEAVLLSNIGGVLSQQGEAGQALDLYQQALEIYRATAEAAAELELQNNLAVLYRQMGEPDEALRIYENVVARSRETGNEAALGRALNNQGYAYFALGDFERAATYFEQALALRRRQGDRRGERATLSNLGDVEYFRGHFAAARDYHRQALEIGHELKQGSEAGTTSLLAQDLAALGESSALELFATAIAQAEKQDTRGKVEEIRLRQAEGQLRFGKTNEAREAFAQALDYFEPKGDNASAALASTGLGRAERALGHGDGALAAFRRAIGLLERQRTAIENPSLRATFLSTRRLAFEGFALAAVEEFRQEGQQELLLEALTRLEQGRARSLLDLLAEARQKEGEAGPTAALRKERREVLRRMALLAREQELTAQGKRQGDPAGLAAMIEAARAKLDRIDSDLRRDDPRLAALAPARPAPPEAWRGAIGEDARLLHFLLSDEKSLVFVVGRQSLEVVELPPRAQLDTLARQAADALASPTTPDPALAELGKLLFAPLLPTLEGVEKLWIVADGSLNYLPLAALELPPAAGKRNERLVERFEITSLPSGGVFAELLKRRPRHHTIEKIAVFADPVFALNDARGRAADSAAAAGERAGEEGPMRLPGSAGLSRLPGTRFEAESILALAPGKVSLALGFDANRARLEQDAASADVLHLATHGLIDTDHPELSGLALSLFSAEGRWQPEGLLRLDDFAALHLDAELVVLSGCRTALGRQQGGEGLLGLARGLFYAGSRRVLASLWPVRDRATAELMASFYRSLLAGSSPSSSLRLAQLEMLHGSRFSDPFYWAPFVLIGDPR